MSLVYRFFGTRCIYGISYWNEFRPQSVQNVFIALTTQRDHWYLFRRCYRRRLSAFRSPGGATNSSSDTTSSRWGSGGRSEIFSSICACFSKYLSFSSRACRSSIRWTMSFFFWATRCSSNCLSTSACLSTVHCRYTASCVPVQTTTQSSTVTLHCSGVDIQRAQGAYAPPVGKIRNFFVPDFWVIKVCTQNVLMHSLWSIDSQENR